MYLLDKTVYLLVVMSNADGAVKAAMCTHDNLLQHLDCLVRLQQPHLVEVGRREGGAAGGRTDSD